MTLEENAAPVENEGPTQPEATPMRAILALHQLAELLAERESTFPWAVRWCLHGDALPALWLACATPMPMYQLLMTGPGRVVLRRHGITLASAGEQLPVECRHIPRAYAQKYECLCRLIRCAPAAKSLRKIVPTLSLADLDGSRGPLR